MQATSLITMHGWPPWIRCYFPAEFPFLCAVYHIFISSECGAVINFLFLSRNLLQQENQSGCHLSWNAGGSQQGSESPGSNGQEVINEKNSVGFHISGYILIIYPMLYWELYDVHSFWRYLIIVIIRFFGQLLWELWHIYLSDN